MLDQPSVPSDVTGKLLELAEFMEREDEALPIDVADLARYALRCESYAKSLHYR